MSEELGVERYSPPKHRSYADHGDELPLNADRLGVSPRIQIVAHCQFQRIGTNIRVPTERGVWGPLICVIGR